MSLGLLVKFYLTELTQNQDGSTVVLRRTFSKYFDSYFEVFKKLN